MQLTSKSMNFLLLNNNYTESTTRENVFAVATGKDKISDHKGTDLKEEDFTTVG